MVDENLTGIPWIIARIKNEVYGLPSTYVREMVKVPNLTPVPRTPEFVRGVINLRGVIIALIDLRLFLGMPSVNEENEGLIANLNQREQDHLNWLNNLTNSVESKLPFSGQVDPHKCAFGLWYDNFKTDEMLLAALLKRFDAPHKAIHGIAARVKDLQSNGLHDEAMAVINHTRENELAEMIKLFQSTRDLLRSGMREIAIVLTDGKDTMAVSVDVIESVEVLSKSGFEELPISSHILKKDVINGTGKRKKADEIVLLVDVPKIIHSADLVLGAQLAKETA